MNGIIESIGDVYFVMKDALKGTRSNKSSMAIQELGYSLEYYMRKVTELEAVTVLEQNKRIEELEAELVVSDRLLEDRQRLLSAIPACPAHGLCVSHALEWIEQVKTLAAIVSGK